VTFKIGGILRRLKKVGKCKEKRHTLKVDKVGRTEPYPCQPREEPHLSGQRTFLHSILFEMITIYYEKL
jgi:hypothetical protein